MPRFPKRSTLIAIAGAAFACDAAVAQTGTGFTISDGDTFFTQGNSPSGSSGPTGTGAAGASFRVAGAAATDHVFQHWWWYRINGADTREFALANAAGTTVTANMAVTTWTYPSFTVQLTYLVTDAGESAGRMHETLRITNTSASMLSMALFNYTDFDLNQTSSLDSATLGMCPTVIRLSESPTTAEFEGYGANAYAVAIFASLRIALSDAAVTNLANTGLPFGPADFTGAMQWNRMIAPGATTVIELELRLNLADAVGACCLPDGTCMFTSVGCCREMGGVYRGDGIACADIACVGACCMSRCSCAVMMPAACAAAGGTYQGDGTTCGAAACFPRPACPCNWNANEALDSQDFFDFIADLFEGRADYNCDSLVNSQDFFDFIACLLDAPSGCP